MPATHILYISNQGLSLDGSDQMGLYLRRFSRDGYRCDLACPRDLQKSALPAALQSGLHRVPGLAKAFGWRTIFSRVRTVRALLQIVRTRGIHLVHSFNTRTTPYALAVARQAGIPAIAQVRNAAGNPRHFVRCRIHRAHVVLTPAPSLRRQILELTEAQAPADREVLALPNAIDAGEYRRQGGAGDIRVELGIEPDAPVVGVVSRFTPHKHPLQILEVARLTAAVLPRVRFLFVGGFKDSLFERAVLARRDELGLGGSCRFLGHRSDPARFYRGIDVLLHASEREGHPKVFNEAMVFSRPIVAARAIGSIDVVEDGVNGLLAEPADAPGMAAALLKLLQSADLRRQMGEAGRRRVETLYSPERVLGALAGVYGSVLGQSRAAG